MPKKIPPGKAKGTGRPDYSTSVDVATVPIIRSHQYRLRSLGGITMPPSSMVYFIADQPFRTYKSVWFDMRMFAEANVLLELIFGTYNAATGVITEMADKLGYQEVSMTMPKGLLVKKLGPHEYLLVGMTNGGDVETNVRFVVHGLYDKRAE